MKRHKRRMITGILLFTVIGLILFIGIREKMAKNTKSDELPGILTGIIYNRTRGMVSGGDFYIELSSEEVSPKQWAEAESILLDLYPVLEPRPKENTKGLLNLFRGVLRKGTTLQDGGDRDELTLVWNTENGKETVEYYWPSDSRVLTLTGLLEEIAKGDESNRSD